MMTLEWNGGDSVCQTGKSSVNSSQGRVPDNKCYLKEELRDFSKRGITQRQRIAIDKNE